MNDISLLYLSTGSGHLVAAQAIADALARECRDLSIQAYDPMERLFPGASWLENLGLAFSMRFMRRSYDVRWRTGNSKWVGWASRWRLFEGGMPEAKDCVVIATHVFPLRLALATRERRKVPWRIYGVATDFGLHGYWPVHGVDGYFVAHSDLSGELAQRGVAVEKIHSTGIPLRLDFEAQEVWEAPRAGGALRVALLAGGLQSGAYSGSIEWLVQFLNALPFDPALARFTIIAGSRVHFQEEVERSLKHSKWDVHVRGMVRDMAGLLHSHDLVIGKPGGLTVAETLACGRPLVVQQPGPGQESANAAFLARHGLLIEGYKPEQAAAAVTRAVRDRGWLLDCGRQARSFGRSRSAAELARIVLSELK